MIGEELGSLEQISPVRIIFSFPEVMNSTLRLHIESQQKYTQSVLDFLEFKLYPRAAGIVIQESLPTLRNCVLQQ